MGRVSPQLFLFFGPYCPTAPTVHRLKPLRASCVIARGETHERTPRFGGYLMSTRAIDVVFDLGAKARMNEGEQIFDDLLQYLEDRLTDYCKDAAERANVPIEVILKFRDAAVTAIEGRNARTDTAFWRLSDEHTG